jgi:hypothetical protein
MGSCGVNFSFFFQDDGLSHSSPLNDSSVKLILISAGVCINIVASFFSNSDFNPGIPRKLAIAVGLSCMSVFQCIGGYLLQTHSSSQVSVFVLFMILASFEFGLGTFYWAYLSELLKVQRISLAITALWSTEVLMAFIYYQQSYYFSVCYLYYSHAAFNLLLAPLIYCFGVETLGTNWKELSDNFSEERLTLN